MRHPVSRDLFAYWNTLRAGRSAPERSAIDPAEIRHLLAYTFLLEVGSPDDGAGPRSVSFRLSGTRLNALFRRELKGASFLALWAEDEAAEAATLVDGVLDGCVPVVAGVRASPRDYRPIDFELLLLPLRHHGRTHARLLGSIVAETVPSWIGLRQVEPMRLVSFRAMHALDGRRLGRFGSAARDPGPVAPPLAQAETVPSRIPAGARSGLFRVYDGGRSAAGAGSLGPATDPG